VAPRAGSSPGQTRTRTPLHGVTCCLLDARVGGAIRGGGTGITAFPAPPAAVTRTGARTCRVGSRGHKFAVSQDHDRRCWASLRKPLEDQGRVTMVSTWSRLGYRRRRGPTCRNLAAGTATWGIYDISRTISGRVRAGEGWTYTGSGQVAALEGSPLRDATMSPCARAGDHGPARAVFTCRSQESNPRPRC